MMPADQVARLGYRGLMAGRRVVIAGAMNRLLAFAGRYGPRGSTLRITERLMSSD